ncbi:acyltransferase family protein [Filimonas effusa]|uniref:Acyltransferase 3 domain-containing protein n=1 Tax=Filimonas effusa TaxID=2508721 RepID=A0A4Q1DE89_9BACT|nr:acyltransferase family protein [Filimonas effusa]RXK86909.1 hypothetical protein ESB13_09000 [Filimonas effusa]
MIQTFLNLVILKKTNTVATLNNGYEVIDTIRFVAISSVIWGHSYLPLDSQSPLAPTDSIIHSVALELGKTGTILFFLISGFLLNRKIREYTIGTFMKSRLRSTILPWVTVILFFAVMYACFDPVFQSVLLPSDSMKLVKEMGLILKMMVFHYSFWFIPVFLVSVSVLIILKRLLYDSWLFVLSLCITIFYNCNLYYNWFNASHTTAFLAYVSVMLLGIHVHKNFGSWMAWCSRITWWHWITLYLITLVITCFEGNLLSMHKSVDPYASLRVSNLMNALVVFVGLCKIGPVKWIEKFNPRQTVFGIFLVHNIFGWLFVYTLRQVFKLPAVPYVSLSLLLSVFIFLLNFAFSYLFVCRIRLMKRNYSWSAG